MNEHFMTLTRVYTPNANPSDIVRQKHTEFYNAARRYRLLYYATRLIGGLCAGILPFVVYPLPMLATGLSITLVVIVVLDTVFNPMERWKSLSRATDLLYLAALQKEGKYDEVKQQWEIILKAEDQIMTQLLDMVSVIQKAKETAEQQSK